MRFAQSSPRRLHSFAQNIRRNHLWDYWQWVSLSGYSLELNGLCHFVYLNLIKAYLNSSRGKRGKETQLFLLWGNLRLHFSQEQSHPELTWPWQYKDKIDRKENFNSLARFAVSSFIVYKYFFRSFENFWHSCLYFNLKERYTMMNKKRGSASVSSTENGPYNSV